MNKQKFNSGHIIEGLDRCHTIQILIEELLEDHPAVIKAKAQRQIMRAASQIADAYQMIGNLE